MPAPQTSISRLMVVVALAAGLLAAARMSLAFGYFVGAATLATGIAWLAWMGGSRRPSLIPAMYLILLGGAIMFALTHTDLGIKSELIRHLWPVLAAVVAGSALIVGGGIAWVTTPEAKPNAFAIEVFVMLTFITAGGLLGPISTIGFYLTAFHR